MKELLESEFKETLGIIDVMQEGSCAGYSWTVTWRSVGGDKAPLEVPEYSLTGFDINVKVDTLQDGGITISPLTGEFLQVVKSSSQVKRH